MPRVVHRSQHNCSAWVTFHTRLTASNGYTIVPQRALVFGVTSEPFVWLSVIVVGDPHLERIHVPLRELHNFIWGE